MRRDPGKLEGFHLGEGNNSEKEKKRLVRKYFRDCSLFCDSLWLQMSNLGKWQNLWGGISEGLLIGVLIWRQTSPLFYKKENLIPGNRICTGCRKIGNFPSCFALLFCDFTFHLWTWFRNSGISLMKMYSASRQELEKSEKKRRKSRSVRVRVKMKRTRSFTTPKTCRLVGMAK